MLAAAGLDGCGGQMLGLSATSGAALPAGAAGRPGIQPGQQNLLIRIVLRDLERTLTNEAANALRDQIYLAIHQGAEHQRAGRR